MQESLTRQGGEVERLALVGLNKAHFWGKNTLTTQLLQITVINLQYKISQKVKP